MSGIVRLVTERQVVILVGWKLSIRSKSVIKAKKLTAKLNFLQIRIKNNVLT